MSVRKRLGIVVVGAIALCACVVAAADEMVYATRDEIPIADRWNRADILASTEAFDQAVAKVETALPVLRSYAGRLGSSADVMAEALEARFAIEPVVDDIVVWASQWRHEDTRGAEAAAYEARARGVIAAYTEAVAFFTPEIAQLPPDTLERYLADERLATYAHRLDDILRTRAHIRSAEVEEVLAASALLRGAPGEIYSNLHDADIRWPKIEGAAGEQVTATPSLFYQLLSSPDRRVRRDAAKAIFSTYDEYGNTFAGTLAGSIHKDVWLAKVRGYDSTLDMALDRVNVPRSVVETLVSSVHDNIAVVHDYVTLRRRLLGLDAIHIYDLYVPLSPEAERRYTFDEGWQLATEFWRSTFGDEYLAVAGRARAERWIDVYPNVGKRGGAYSWGTYNSHPYLLLNWGGTLEDVFTLVHEMGHSIHSYLANSNQPYHDADYALFVAEVASVASESLFYEWMLARTDDPQERLALVNNRINGIVGTFLRQIFFHEFEATAHAMAERGEPLTKGSLGEAWGTLWKSYYGPDATLDDEVKYGHARISHFYRTFYVWVYATSFAAGEAIAGRFRAGDESAVEGYLEMLKLGGSVYPMEAVARTGVDMNDPEVIRTVMVRFGETIREMEKLLQAGSERPGSDP